MTETKNMRAVFKVMKENINELETLRDRRDDIRVDPNVITAKRNMLKILKNNPEDPRCERFSSLLRTNPMIECCTCFDNGTGYHIYSVEEYMNQEPIEYMASIEDNRVITKEARKVLDIMSRGRCPEEGYHMPFSEISDLLARKEAIYLLGLSKRYAITKDEVEHEDARGRWLIEDGAYAFAFAWG